MWMESHWEQADDWRLNFCVKVSRWSMAGAGWSGQVCSVM